MYLNDVEEGGETCERAAPQGLGRQAGLDGRRARLAGRGSASSEC